jgi:hypothetical protein
MYALLKSAVLAKNIVWLKNGEHCSMSIAVLLSWLCVCYGVVYTTMVV